MISPNSSGITKKQLENRACSRVMFEKKVKLSLENGAAYDATTQNISLGGVNVFTTDEHECQAGQSAFIQIYLDKNKSSQNFPCTLVRCEAKLISLRLDPRVVNSFGLLITKDILKQKTKETQ